MITTILKGFCMGAADIIPGVSGGTIALILGFYTRLIDAIRSFDGTLLRYLYQGDPGAAARRIDLVFLLSLGFGIVMALLFFTHVIPLPILLHTHPEFVYGLFFGLLIASVGFLIRALEYIEPRDGLWLVLGAVAGYWIVGLTPIHTPEEPWFIFLSGSIAICAMILPGISGSFMLLILKKYAYLLDAFSRLDLGVLVPFGLGAAAGLLLFSRFLAWLLRNFYRPTFLVITGVLMGSLWIIWPFQSRTYLNIEGKSHLVRSMPVWPREFDETTVAVLFLILLGMAIMITINSFVKRT
uniref:Putative membrane protein n=1 Tax=Candidatus Kentrum sp. TC TaxID=2126339 RepID=A0A450Y847_9GAMM|nr:MAG: putative membrane protein [Candidatus Kentron sp. TC]VFK40863.1 MAG: putative membrane protein [Candidatus Kentron sp. TC]